MPERLSRRDRRREIERQQRKRLFVRRTALKLLAAAAGGAIGIYLAPSLEEKKDILFAEKDLRESLIVPKYELLNSQKFKNEGWLDQVAIPDEIKGLPLDELASIYMNRVTDAMFTSGYAPFEETAKVMHANVESSIDIEAKRKNGEISPLIQEIRPENVTRGVGVFATRAFVSPNETWYFALVLNSFWLREDVRNLDSSISALWYPLTIATSLGHEMLGHYKIHQNLIRLLTSEGLETKEAAEVSNSYLGHEPYSYAVQAEIIRPFMFAFNLEGVLPASLIKITTEWERYREMPAGWYNPSWMKFIEDFEHEVFG